MDSVDKILSSSINLSAGGVLRDARDNRAEELVKDYVRRESGAVALIDKLLARAGMTIETLIVPHLQAQLEPIEQVDRLSTIAETRRDANLREIDRRRSALGDKLRRSMQEIEQSEITLIETTTGKGKDAA